MHTKKKRETDASKKKLAHVMTRVLDNTHSRYYVLERYITLGYLCDSRMPNRRIPGTDLMSHHIISDII